MYLGDAVNVYLYQFLPFVVQLVLCEALFVFKLKRRPAFVVRLISGLVVFCALAFLTACAAVAMPSDPLLGTLPYMVMFMFSLLIAFMCFDTPFKIILLYGVAAYAFQNTAYRVSSLFEITGVVWRFATAVDNYALAYNVVYWSVFAVLTPIVYFCFVRRINMKGAENIYNRNVLLISAVTLGIVLVMCSYTNMWWWQSWYLSIINYCFTILGNVFVIAIISGMFENLGLKNEIATIRQLWLQDKRQYEIAKENIDLINIKCHDLKHKIRAIRNGADASDAELKEIENAVAIYDSVVHTGCDPIDVVLTEKSLICAKRNIKLSCMADGSGLAFMNESELYSLFGNMLTNAVNAVCKLADESARVIDLTVLRNAGLSMIHCINYFDGEIAFDGELPKTDKQDASEHGFGMKSMRMLVKKYGGEMFLTAENGVFDLKIVIPERTVKAKGSEEKVA